MRTARILEKRLDDEGRVCLLLDRVVHEKYVGIEGWLAGGCFVTELVADGRE